MHGKNKKKKILNILAISGVIIFFLLLRWNSFNSPFERDEGEYAYSAWLLKQNILPYVNSFIQKPPMIIYTYLLSLFIDQNAYWPPRFLAAIFEIGVIFLTGVISKKEFGKSTALIAMWLVTPMIMFFYLYSLAANTEKFMLLPMLGALTVYVYNKDKEVAWPWFLFGILSVFAIYYKQIVLLPLLFIYAVWIVKNWQKYRKLKISFKNSLFVVLGFLLTSILVLGFFLLRGGGTSIWESTVFLNKYYVKNYGFSISHFLRHLKLFFTKWWLLFFFLGWFFYKRPPSWWFYWGLFFTSLLSVCLSPLGHYYLILMPFWAIITASAINSLPKMKVLVTAIVLLTMILSIRKQFFLSAEELNLLVYTKDNPFIEAPIVAKRIVDLTSSKDYVYIVGCEPQILFYAKRKSPSRFITNYPLIIDSPRKNKYQKEAIVALETQPPKAIVFSQKHLQRLWSNNKPELFANYIFELLAKDYKLTGGFIWQDNEGYWQEPIDENQKDKASLLLFIRK